MTSIMRMMNSSTAFWFGSAFYDECKEEPDDSIDCHTEFLLRVGGYSLVDLMAKNDGANLTSGINKILIVSYTSKPGNPLAKANNFIPCDDDASFSRFLVISCVVNFPSELCAPNFNCWENVDYILQVLPFCSRKQGANEISLSSQLTLYGTFQVSRDNKAKWEKMPHFCLVHMTQLRHCYYGHVPMLSAATVVDEAIYTTLL